jgi:DNA-binding PucR family transcriptional regulator
VSLIVCSDFAALGELVEQSLDEITQQAADRVLTEIPSYRDNTTPTLREEVIDHSRAVVRRYLEALTTHTVDDATAFTTTADFALRRVMQEVTLDDFLRAFRITQNSLWRGILRLADNDSDLLRTAGESVELLLEVFENASTAASDAYLEAQQYLTANKSDVMTDLTESLIAGRIPFRGPRRACLATAGLAGATDYLLVSGIAVGRSIDHPDLLTRIARAWNLHGRGILADIRGEFVAIIPVKKDRIRAYADVLTKGLVTLASQDIDLSVGVSSVHSDLEQVPLGYREAQTALQVLRGRPGLQSLDALTAFDYLVSRQDDVARELIPAGIRTFIEQDLDAGGSYVETLLTYIYTDLNAKAAADKLYIHPNTAYYRIDRIASRTGRDLRSFGDLLELYTAVKLLQPRLAGDEKPPIVNHTQLR